MITVHYHNNEKSNTDLSTIAQDLQNNRRKFFEISYEQILTCLDEFTQKAANNPQIQKMPGAEYILKWLKNAKEHVTPISQYESLHTHHTKNVIAVPRGVVCHWIATNVPNLPFFSLIQCILSKNASIAKVSEEQAAYLLPLLKELKECQNGEIITSCISVVSFSSEHKNIAQQFSLCGDAHIVWGGSNAIQEIRSLPQKDHAEMIVYGPKFSFSLFAKDAIESSDFEETLKKAALDMVLFNQMACSSPHVFFFEESALSNEQIAQKLQHALESLPKALLHQPLPESTSATIIATRAAYLLDPNKNIKKSDDLSYTILIDEDPKLEDPVQGKTIFIKRVQSLETIIPQVTRKVQAISIAIKDQNRLEGLSRQAAYYGADRITQPGKIHEFDFPWDGVFPLQRLVRWVSVEEEKNA